MKRGEGHKMREGVKGGGDEERIGTQNEGRGKGGGGG